MRLWSIHPQYLDVKGLVALWREALLAKKVLEGKTKGYSKHPQLERFKRHPSPGLAINTYLLSIWEEANRRGYNFSKSKINENEQTAEKIAVTQGQIAYEKTHLEKKLAIRDQVKYGLLSQIESVKEHPLFTIIPGSKETWEK